MLPAKKNELLKVLAQRTSFEAVDETVTSKQLRLRGRIDKNKNTHWLMVVHHLLVCSSKSNSPWTCDISKQMVVKDDNLRFAWRIIIQSQDLNDEVMTEIIAAVAHAPMPSRVELESAPLPGYRPGQVRGGQDSRGRGAAGVFSAITGKGAADRFNNGGQ